MTALPTTLPIMNSVVDQSRTRYVNQFERPIAAGVSSVVDGMALVGDYTDPIDEKATPCAGTGSEKFLGVAIVGVVNVTQLPLVEEQVAPTVAPAATVTITLQKTPKVGATFKLYRLDTGGAVTAGVAASGNALYSISGAVVTVGGLLMGVQLRAIYVYEPTYAEVLARFHQASINFDNTNTLLQQVAIGGGAGSEIFTNVWDSENGQFTNGGSVALGASGRFTAGGAGNVVGVVIKAPTTEDSTLGFRVTAVA
jgi:hypothetical protein